MPVAFQGIYRRDPSGACGMPRKQGAEKDRVCACH